MTTQYVALKQVQNSRFTFVEALHEIFENKQLAEEYQAWYNEQYPESPVVIKPKTLVKKVDFFPYIECKVTCIDAEYESMETLMKKGCSVELPNSKLQHVDYKSSTRGTFYESGVKTNTIHTFVIKKKIENEDEIRSMEQLIKEEEALYIELVQKYSHMELFGINLEECINAKEPHLFVQEKTEKLLQKIERKKDLK